MSEDTVKLKTDAKLGGTAASSKPAVANNVSGRVKHDDRGNAIWEWAATTGQLSLETSTQRLKKLDNLSLSLAEDAPPTTPGEWVKPNPRGVTQGYSPYDSGLLAKKAPSQPKKDLRKLSEWLKLKKQADSNKPDED